MRNNKNRVLSIIEILKNEYPEAKIRLNYSNPFNLLVATILSAQCTDDRVNIVTKDLFNELKSPEDFVKIPQEHLEKMIYSTGFYKAKAKNIKAMSEIISNEFKGRVPNNMDDLLKLPGVGRKTANVILGHCFKPAGITVDTHVKRISYRLGLTKSKNPLIIEKDLIALVPKKYWTLITHLLINHGRKICKARKPKCNDCKLNHLCPKII